MTKKLWALLYHNEDEYAIPEVLAVSENAAHLRQVASKDALLTFGTGYVEAHDWDGTAFGCATYVNKDDETQSEYLIVEVTNGIV